MYLTKRGLLIVSVVFISLIYQNSGSGADIVQGRAYLYVKSRFVEFPREIYGLAISFPEKSVQVKVDSVYFLNFYGPKRHDYKDEHILKNSFMKQHSPIYDRVQLNFSRDLIELFKRYGVYSIERVYKPYLSSDTIPQPHVKRDGTTIMYTGKNENTFLLVKFDPAKNVYDFIGDVQKINGIERAEVVSIVKEGTRLTE